MLNNNDNKKDLKNQNKEKQVMHSTIAHHPLMPDPLPEPRSAPLPCKKSLLT